jgi:hypothetical protein
MRCKDENGKELVYQSLRLTNGKILLKCDRFFAFRVAMENGRLSKLTEGGGDFGMTPRSGDETSDCIKAFRADAPQISDVPPSWQS